MSASKEDFVQLSSPLCPRTSASLEADLPRPRSSLFAEKLYKWFLEKPQRAYLIGLSGLFVLAVWITLFSLQISALREARSQADVIAELRTKIELIFNELDEVKASSGSQRSELAGFLSSLTKLQDEGQNLRDVANALNASTISLQEKLKASGNILALEIETTQTLFKNNLQSTEEKLSQFADQSLRIKTKVEELDLDMDLIKIALNDTQHLAGHHINTSLNDHKQALSNALSKIETIFNNSLNEVKVETEISEKVDLIEQKLGNSKPHKVGDIKYSTLQNDHDGWLICDGRSLNRQTFAELYKVLVHSDGHWSTFNLIDARGRSPLGAGKGHDLTNRGIGQLGGEEETFLSLDQIPEHRHDLNTQSQQVASSSTFGSKVYITGLTSSRTGIELVNNGWLDPKSAKSHSNMHPFIVLNTFIYSGVEPSS